MKAEACRQKGGESTTLYTKESIRVKEKVTHPLNLILVLQTFDKDTKGGVLTTLTLKKNTPIVVCNSSPSILALEVLKFSGASLQNPLHAFGLDTLKCIVNKTYLYTVPK